MGLLFQHPEWSGQIAIALALVAGALLVGSLRARRRLETLLGPGQAMRTRRTRSDIVLFGALVLIGLALLGPRLARREVQHSTGGTDVVMLLDVSQSMNAEDVLPSRLARARRALEHLFELLSPRDRAALAAFAGRGVLFTPLTHDRDALIKMLPALDSGLIRPAGTDLRSGVEAAITAFADGERRPRVVLVLSDGEIMGASRQTGHVAAQRNDVRIIAVALGSERGASVPDGGVPLRDGNDRVVVSRRHTTGLETLARATGGELFLADEWGQIDMTQLAKAIDRDLAQPGGEPSTRFQTTAMVLPFAAGAAILLWLEALPRRSRRSRHKRGPRPDAGADGRWLLMTMALLVLLAASPASRQTVQPGADRPRADSARDHFARGLAEAAAGRPRAGQRSFRTAALISREPALAALAHHNLGVLALEQGDLARAREAFYDSLALAPTDSQTRFNLAWTLRELASRQPPPATSDSRAPDEVEEPEPAADEAAPGAVHHPGADRRLPALTKSERERWLARVKDDPGKAMRAVAEDRRGGGTRRVRRGGATW